MGGEECNNADKNINKSKIKYKMERKGGGGTQPLEGDAWNITIYKLLLDLHRDPFIVGYHVPQWLGQQEG